MSVIIYKHIIKLKMFPPAILFTLYDIELYNILYT